MNPWTRFWFATTRRHSTGLFRIVACAWLALDLGPILLRLDRAWELDNPMMEPCAGLRWIGFLGAFEPHDAAAVLRVAGLVFLATSLLGAGTRISLLGLACVNFAVRSVQNSYGYVGHASILPSLALFVLAVSPGAAAWSVDAAARWLLRGKGALRDALAGPPIPVWPVHLLLAMLSLTYLASGISKFRAGASWWSGRTLQWYLEGNAGDRRLGDSVQFFSADRGAKSFRDPWGLETVANSAGRTTLGGAVASSRALCAAASWLTVAIELGFALVFVLPRRGQAALLLAAAGLHAAIAVLMSIDFGGYVLLYLAAVDWEALLRSLGSFFPGVGRGRAG